MVQCMTEKYILTEIAKHLFSGPIILDIEQLLTKIESETHRHYHTLNHVYSVFCELELNSKNRLLDFLFALCHDIVYDPHRDDNEQQSILYISKINTIYNLPCFRELKKAIKSTKDLNCVNRFTTADRNDVLLESCYDQVEYFKNIRKEYSFVPWNIFVEAHLKIVSQIRKSHHRLPNNGYERMVRNWNSKQIIIRYYQHSWNSWGKKTKTVSILFKDSSKKEPHTESKKYTERMKKWS